MKQDVADVVAVCQAAETAIPKEAVQAFIERSVDALVAGVVRRQEFPCEGINVAVGHV